MCQVLSTHWFVATLPKRLMCQRGRARWPFFRPRKASGSPSAQPFKPPSRHWAARRRPTPDTHILPWTLTQRADGALPFSVSMSVLNFTSGVGSFNWVMLGYISVSGFLCLGLLFPSVFVEYNVTGEGDNNPSESMGGENNNERGGVDLMAILSLLLDQFVFSLLFVLMEAWVCDLCTSFSSYINLNFRLFERLSICMSIIGAEYLISKITCHRK